MMSQSWVGKSIGGRYRIEALLGQGGMSAVYRALDPNLQRNVAIKLIHPHLSSDPNFVSRFKTEAAAAARLRHPNIVQVHDFNQDDGIYYLVMDYLVGETLQARLKRLNLSGRNMPFSEAIDVCAQICQAVGYAHEHELIHRDIKPANIILDVHGQAILMDFGIVKIIGGEHHTGTGATLGTALYMSPEQIRSQRVDERTDIYSLGVTLYEMLSGRPPYQADSALTLMMMVLNDPLPDLRTLRPQVPEALAAVVYKALAKDRKDRFSSMLEMGEALRKVQAGLVAESPEATLVDSPQEAEATVIKPPTPDLEAVETGLDEPVEDATRIAEEIDKIEAGEEVTRVAEDIEDVEPAAEAAPSPEAPIDEPESPVESVPALVEAKPPVVQENKPVKQRISKRMWIYVTGAFIILAGIVATIVILSTRVAPAEELAAIPTATRLAQYTVTPVPTRQLFPTVGVSPAPLPEAIPTEKLNVSPEAVAFRPGEPVKIGYLLWMNDPMGIDSLRGIELALAEFEGRIPGHPIELVGFNDECNPQVAQLGAEELMQDQAVVGIIGTNCSPGALRAAPIISEANRVMISPGSTSPLLTAGEIHAPGFFRTVPNDRVQTFAAASFAYERLGMRRLAVIFTVGDPDQEVLGETVCAAFTAQGGECVMQLPIEPDDRPMQPLVNQLIEARADVVYYLGYQNEQAARFIATVRAAPDLPGIPIILSENFYNPDFIAAAGENAVGAFVSTTSMEFEPIDAYMAFLDVYRNRYREDPISQFHAYAYDAALLLLNAITRVVVLADDGTLFIDPLAIREVLYGPPGIPGLTGLLICEPSGDCAANPHGVVFEFANPAPDSFRPGTADMEGSNPVQVWP
jgi:serine/threonine protein kinase/ABC-type branched-subunit amino acid transport system substrate-binding protein